MIYFSIIIISAGIILLIYGLTKNEKTVQLRPLTSKIKDIKLIHINLINLFILYVILPFSCYLFLYLYEPKLFSFEFAVLINLGITNPYLLQLSKNTDTYFFVLIISALIDFLFFLLLSYFVLYINEIKFKKFINIISFYIIKIIIFLLVPKLSS